MATYEVYLQDTLGTRLRPINQFSQLTWAKGEGVVGSFELKFSDQTFQEEWYNLDSRVEIRRISNGLNKLIMVGFLRYPEQLYRGSEFEWILRGEDSNDLLDRRIVAARVTSAEANKSGNADDLMKEYVDEWLGSSAAAADDITAYGFSIAPDLSLGPSVDVALAYDNLLAGLYAIQQAAIEEGQKVVFQVSNPTPSTFLFETFLDRLGDDRTGSNRTIISPERGSLSNARYIYDRRAEVTAVVVGGQGEKLNRTLLEVTDPDRLDDSPLNRIVAFQDARDTDDTDILTSRGNERLQEGRPLQQFTADILDTPGNRFGIDWDYGDRVLVTFRGLTFPVEIANVSGKIDGNGLETISARISEVFE